MVGLGGGAGSLDAGVDDDDDDDDDDGDISWKEVGKTSHTLDTRRGRRMTGSAGTAVDVLVTCDSCNGRRVWEEGGEKLPPIGHFGCWPGIL